MDLSCFSFFPACPAESGDGKKKIPIPLSAGTEKQKGRWYYCRMVTSLLHYIFIAQ